MSETLEGNPQRRITRRKFVVGAVATAIAGVLGKKVEDHTGAMDQMIRLTDVGDPSLSQVSMNPSKPEKTPTPETSTPPEVEFKPIEIGKNAKLEYVFYGDLKIKKSAFHADLGKHKDLNMRTSPELKNTPELERPNEVDIDDVKELQNVDIENEDDFVVSFPVLVSHKDDTSPNPTLYWQVDALVNDRPFQRDDRKKLYMQVSDLTQPHFKSTVRPEYEQQGGTNGGRLYASVDEQGILGVRMGRDGGPVTRLSSDNVNVITIPETPVPQV